MGTETDLILRLQAGDNDSLKDLYELLADNIYALARQLLGSREDAEEVLQDTFLKLYNSAERFDPDLSSGRAYIYTIARNEARMRLRAGRSRPVKAHIDLHEAAGTFSNPREPDHEAQLTVERALGHLNADDAQLLRASFFEGYSHAELSEQTGLPLGTIKSRIRRAFQSLRKRLGDV